MRIAISTSAALFITLALFYIMQIMISGSGQYIEKPENYGVVDFIRLQREPEDAKSKPLKQTLPRKPPSPPGTPPSPKMKLTAVQPPAAASQSESAREPMEPMQLGKPYLGPLTTVIPNSQPLKKPDAISKIKTPPKPLPAQKTEMEPANVMKAPSTDKKTLESALMSSDQQPVGGGAVAPDVTAPGLPGEIGDYEGEAIPVFKMEPKYPRKAAKSRIEGWVKVEFTITEKGTVIDARVVDSRPRRTFDRSAVQSIRKWRFRPRVVNGKAVQRKASQVIEFKLARG